MKNKSLLIMIIILCAALIAVAITLPLLVRDDPSDFFGKQTVTYEAEGKTYSSEVAYGQEFAIEVPTRQWYTFEGLYAEETLETKIVDRDGKSVGKYMSTEKTVVLYPDWKEREYSAINYRVDNQDVVLEVSRLYEGPVYSLSVPAEKEGYQFVCWEYNGESITDEQGLLCSEWEKGEIVNATLQARFTPVYTIEYDLNGGSAEALVERYSAISDTFSLATPTRVGYDFVGWSGTSLDGVTQSVTVPKGSEGARSYTANWTVHPYNIFYRNLTGNYDIDVPVNPNETTYTVDSQTITLQQASKGAYQFVRWTDDAGDPVSEIPTGSRGDRTIYAEWTPVTYTIEYDWNGWSETKNRKTYTVETPAFTLENPTRLGYEFAGWSGTGLNGLTPTVTIPQKSFGDRTYTASNAIPKTYSITYELNGGTADNQTEYDIESSVTLFAATRAGYVFLGWQDVSDKKYVSKIEEGSVGDRKFNAVWCGLYDIPFDIQALDHTDSMKYNPTKVNTDQLAIEEVDENLFDLSLSGAYKNKGGSDYFYSDAGNLSLFAHLLQNANDLNFNRDAVVNGRHSSGYKANLSNDSCSSVYNTSINERVGSGAVYLKATFENGETTSAFATDIFKDTKTEDALNLVELTGIDLTGTSRLEKLKVTIVYEINLHWDAGWNWIAGDHWTSTAWRVDFELAFSQVAVSEEPPAEEDKKEPSSGGAVTLPAYIMPKTDGDSFGGGSYVGPQSY